MNTILLLLILVTLIDNGLVLHLIYNRICKDKKDKQ
jgi:hypothetical protein